MYLMNMTKHRCKHFLFMKQIEINCIIQCIPFYYFKMKIIVKMKSQIILKGSKGYLYFIQFIFRFFY
jgi:hypothetical protein